MLFLPPLQRTVVTATNRGTRSNKSPCVSLEMTAARLRPHKRHLATPLSQKGQNYKKKRTVGSIHAFVWLASRPGTHRWHQSTAAVSRRKGQMTLVVCCWGCRRVFQDQEPAPSAANGGAPSSAPAGEVFSSPKLARCPASGS